MSLDAVGLQVVTGALRAACEEMGAALVRSAHSANIKERRDASTALFDPAGEMLMQAEHIPVHLGAMPAAVEAILEEDHAPDRAWILNDPYRGGTHLPDITVIMPVFAPVDGRADEPGELIAFAANRAHHADVGGPTPGSMPADSRTLADEGVVIEPRVLDDRTIAELAEQMRQPTGGSAGCDTAGLRDDDPSGDDLGDRGWDQRRLAGARRCVDHRDSASAKCLRESGQTHGDREVGRRGEQVAQRVGHSCSVPDAHLRTRLRDTRLRT